MNVDEFLNRDVNRRRFLEEGARNAAGVAAGVVGLSSATASSATASSATAAAASQSIAGANDRLRLAVVGVRTRGLKLAQTLLTLPNIEIAALCDVDSRVLHAAATDVSRHQPRQPRLLGDYRHVLDDPRIDAVIIATPDHWHAPIAGDACRAGKDVYLEVPITHTVAEADELIETARTQGCIVQTGLQQRSGAHFQTAMQLIHLGGIGRVQLAKAWVVNRRKPIERQSATAVPQGVDFTGWLGPAPSRAFQSNRFHQNWRWFWDYGSGELGHAGTHMLDVALWGLNIAGQAVDQPQRVTAAGGMLYFDDDRQTPDTLTVDYDFGDRHIVWEHCQWSPHGPEGRTTGVAFYGDRGTLIIDRGGWKVYDQRDGQTAPSSDLLVPHLQSFVNAIRNRKAPSAPLEIASTSNRLVHLGNQAYREGLAIET